MLCTLAINGLSSALKVLSLDPGADFEIVTVSIDPRDTPAAAALKKAGYLERYKRAGAAAGWHFLTGDQPSIDRLTKAAGFRYAWDPETKQFAHLTGIIVLMPDGRMARTCSGSNTGRAISGWPSSKRPPAMRDRRSTHCCCIAITTTR
jgi:protein SCO1/2